MTDLFSRRMGSGFLVYSGSPGGRFQVAAVGSVSGSQDVIQSALDPMIEWGRTRQGPLPPGWKRDT